VIGTGFQISRVHGLSTINPTQPVHPAASAAINSALAIISATPVPGTAIHVRYCFDFLGGPGALADQLLFWFSFVSFLCVPFDKLRAGFVSPLWHCRA
jgi:hypothetical protein